MKKAFFCIIILAACFAQKVVAEDVSSVVKAKKISPDTVEYRFAFMIAEPREYGVYIEKSPKNPRVVNGILDHDLANKVEVGKTDLKVKVGKYYAEDLEKINSALIKSIRKCYGPNLVIVREDKKP